MLFDIYREVLPCKQTSRRHRRAVKKLQQAGKEAKNMLNIEDYLKSSGQMHPTALLLKESMLFIGYVESGQINSPFEVEEFGWRLWRMQKDTPYSNGEVKFDGYNSMEDSNQGKKAYNLI